MATAMISDEMYRIRMKMQKMADGTQLLRTSVITQAFDIMDTDVCKAIALKMAQRKDNQTVLCIAFLDPKNVIAKERTKRYKKTNPILNI